MINASPRWHRWLAVGALCSLVVSCGGSISRAGQLYGEGRIIESEELLKAHERRLADESPRRQAEYGAYRGLSCLVLGNYVEARKWMTFAYALERRYPGALRPDLRRQLDQGWQQLIQHLAAEPVPGPTHFRSE